MDCFSSIFFLSFQDFYTIVLDELVLKVANLAQKTILFWIIYPSLPGMKPTYCLSGAGYVPLIRHTQQLGKTRLFPDELVLEIAARHRDDVLAQPPDQDYNRGRRHTAYTVHFVAIWLMGNNP
jgi:hypothetical protein